MKKIQQTLWSEDIKTDPILPLLLFLHCSSTSIASTCDFLKLNFTIFKN
uniref:Uncharacterized protein n=1 Tax=Meloidogyne enterolobii TaxID=390850 RepID=A0A6V7ULY4_MELEN|nr:unnamed protein product [Meloidogyne enterolobii]